VLLVGCTGLLGGVFVDTVKRAGDIDVVSQLVSPKGLPGAVQELRPDVVIWNNADEELLARSAAAFGCAYSTKFIAIVNDGRTSSLWELRKQRTPLVELSPPLLLSSIRKAAGR
jgi:hypothetical protein